MERASARPCLGIEIEFVADAPQRRQRREARAEPLDAPAFLVDATMSAGDAHGMDVGHQARELLGGGVVAREQDDAAHERMAQHFAVLGRQLETGDIDHQWAQGSRLFLSLLSRVRYRIPHVWCAETYQGHRRRVSGSPVRGSGHPDHAPANPCGRRYTPPCAGQDVPRRSKPHAPRPAEGLTAPCRTPRASREWPGRGQPTGPPRGSRRWRCHWAGHWPAPAR